MTTAQAETRAVKSPIIIGDNVSVKEPVNASALDKYKSKGLQVQQVSLRGVTGGVLIPVLCAIALSLLFIGNSHAGILNGYKIAKASSYYDFAYISGVWDQAKTFDQLEYEESKFDGGFEEWLSLFQKDKAKARKKKADIENSIDFKRRYDLQLAYDEWRDRVYATWWNGYETGRHGETFDEWLGKANSQSASNCAARKFLTACGPVPDWRTEEEKANEKTWMAKADSQRRK